MKRSFKAMNRRRIELLRQRQAARLTPAQEVELIAAEAFVRQWIDARHPLPPLPAELLAFREKGRLP